MATSLLSDLGYTNYILGSIKSVTECLNIVLYKKSSYSTRISLYNLTSFYITYLSGSDSSLHARLTRETSNDTFEYTKNLEDGFDVIVYISAASNTPIGFTEFVNLQGKGVLLGITIGLTRYAEKLDVGVIEVDTGIVDKTSFDKDLDSNYPIVSELSTSRVNPFTTDASRIMSDKKSAAWLSSGIITQEGTWALGITKNINVDPYEKGLTKHGICFYNGDLVMVSWGDSEYSVYSLVQTNSFGYPKTYAESGTLSGNIERLGGRFYYDNTGNLVELITGSKYINQTTNPIIADPWSVDGKVYELPTFFKSSTALKYIPEINNIYLDLDTYLKSYQLIVYQKLGSWFILQQKYSGQYLYVAVSPVSVLYMDYEDLDRAMFVNDQTIILRDLNYYTVFCKPGEKYYTERARAIIEGGRLAKYEDTGILMCITDNATADEEHYQEYYGSQTIPVVFDYEDLSKTVLNRYRRGPYPLVPGIPELVCSFGGLIFYKSGTTINYL